MKPRGEEKRRRPNGGFLTPPGDPEGYSFEGRFSLDYLVPKKTVFISDVHLGLGHGSEEKRKEDLLVAFLRSRMDSTKELFILGDLFDFWFEYRTVIPKGFHRTLAVLQEYTDKGIPVSYLAGNHDFWMKDFFSSELGIRVYRDPVEVRVDGRRMFLHHGDGLAPRDVGYRIVKPILRHPLSVWLYRWLHPDVGVPLAKRSSRTSRRHTGKKDFGEEDGMVAFAMRKIEEGVDIVVMGHRHRPALVPYRNGFYVNLGDWIESRTYAEMVDGQIALHSWEGLS
jgi:UDP-2,3-diacylglucosamine hydrolase